MQKKSRKPAFTLLELIVAMAIIAVLMGLSVFAISAVQVSQRDTERNTTLQNVGIAMEQAYQNFGSYPTPSWAKNQVTFTAPGGATLKPVPLTGASAAIPASANPADASGTMYCYATNGTSYIIGVKLEGTQTYKYIGNYNAACTGQIPN